MLRQIPERLTEDLRIGALPSENPAGQGCEDQGGGRKRWCSNRHPRSAG
jgi:hypothetical protein